MKIRYRILCGLAAYASVGIACYAKGGWELFAPVCIAIPVLAVFALAASIDHYNPAGGDDSDDSME